MKKLLVILGAGSSVSLGMPRVSDLDIAMRNWAAKWGVFDGVACRPNHYEVAWAALAQHLAGAAPVQAPLNYEMTLALLTSLSNWVRPIPHGDPLRDLIGATNKIPDYFATDQQMVMDPAGFGPTISVEQQYTFLIQRLAQHMRMACTDLRARRPTELHAFERFLDALRTRFDVGIYTLNYDNAALQAWPDAFTGFSESVDSSGYKLFALRAVHMRREWGFIYHLHGSVHHTLPARDDLKGVFHDDIRWRDDLTDCRFRDGQLHGSSILDQRSNGVDIPITTIIAGGFKLDQLLIEPFHTIYAALVRHAHEADAILIGGYGFGDAHINRALLSRVTSRQPRPPIAILEWTPPNGVSTAFRQDGWTHRLTAALAVGRGSFQPCIPGTISWLKRENRCEVADGHTAIWHNGFLEASTRLADILSWLYGDGVTLN